MEEAECQAEVLHGELTRRQVQVGMEGGDSAGRQVLGSLSSSSPGELECKSELVR